MAAIMRILGCVLVLLGTFAGCGDQSVDPKAVAQPSPAVAAQCTPPPQKKCADGSGSNFNATKCAQVCPED